MGLVWGSHFPPPPIHPIPRRCGAASVWGGAALWGAAPPASVVNWGGSWLIRAVNEAAGEAGRLPRVWDGPRPGQSDWEGLGGTGRDLDCSYRETGRKLGGTEREYWEELGGTGRAAGAAVGTRQSCGAGLTAVVKPHREARSCRAGVSPKAH